MRQPPSSGLGSDAAGMTVSVELETKPQADWLSGGRGGERCRGLSRIPSGLGAE